MAYYMESMGRFTLDIPDEAIPDCSHSGACDSDVEYWVDKVDWNNISRDSMVSSLSESGAWAKEELEQESDITLRERILWIACCDLAENRS